METDEKVQVAFNALTTGDTGSYFESMGVQPWEIIRSLRAIVNSFFDTASAVEMLSLVIRKRGIKSNHSGKFRKFRPKWRKN
jgi:hypothetical protein